MRATRSFYDFCIATDKRALLDEWDKEKNGELTPETVAAKSNKKVWWQCKKGHEWQAVVKDRAYGRGCPHCARQYTEKVFNALITVAPEVAAQWHPTKNGELTPETTTAKSAKKVWWVCEKGHEWQAKVYNRTNGTGCPYCLHQRRLEGGNDLATVAPEVAAQWHPTLNKGFAPETTVAKSRKKMWWRCSKGHEWQAVVRNRTNGAGCPFCDSRMSKALLERQREMLREAKEELGL